MVNVTAIIGGICTLAVFGWLYRDNYIYKIFEYIYVAVAAGNLLVVAVDYINKKSLVPLMRGDLIWLPSIILGLSLYFQFSKKHGYLSRIPMAFMMGVGSGLGVRAAIHANLVRQMIGTIFVFQPGDMIATINSFLIFIMTVSALLYFIYTVPAKGALGGTQKLGRYVMMAAFGSHVGATFLSRMPLLYGAIGGIVNTEAIYLVPIAAIILLYDIYVKKDIEA